MCDNPELANRTPELANRTPELADDTPELADDTPELARGLAGAVKYVGSDLPPLCSVASDAVGCLNAIADPQAMQVMLSALFAYVLHASQKKQAAA